LAERALEAVAVAQGFGKAGGDRGHEARGGEVLNMDQRVSVGKSAARACQGDGQALVGGVRDNSKFP
jgi:hypothetical protein